MEIVQEMQVHLEHLERQREGEEQTVKLFEAEGLDPAVARDRKAALEREIGQCREWLSKVNSADDPAIKEAIARSRALGELERQREEEAAIAMKEAIARSRAVPIQEIVQLPATVAGMVIGTHRTNLNAIQDATGANLRVPPPQYPSAAVGGNRTTFVCVEGTSEQVEAAVAELREQIERR
eukprot:SAG31_NODE_15130_length_769_cov_0.837313_1_plen_180_part_01